MEESNHKIPENPEEGDRISDAASDAQDSREANSDLGFGTKIGSGTGRLINQDGSFNVKRIGAGIGALNPYLYLISIRWWEFGLIVVISYVILNSGYALLYLMAGIEGLSGAPDTGFFAKFGHAFFFSVQTFTTVGYGTISPVSTAINIIASFEAMTGLLGFALATGVMYGRFSRPSSKIRYSEHAIVAPYREINGFMFRIVNRRRNQLIELEALVVLMWFEAENGEMKQRFERLELERDRVMLFPLTWTPWSIQSKVIAPYAKCRQTILRVPMQNFSSPLRALMTPSPRSFIPAIPISFMK